jgi:hypothetical protein
MNEKKHEKINKSEETGTYKWNSAVEKLAKKVGSLFEAEGRFDERNTEPNK